MTPAPSAASGALTERDAAWLERARDLFDHDRWANERTLESLASITPPRADAVARMAHLVACLELWLSRLGGKGNPPTPLIWPDWPLDETRRRNASAHDAWSKRLERMDSAELHRIVRCTPMTGGTQPYEVAVRDVLVQLPLHGSYHRGQVSVYIKDSGAKPLDVDYIARRIHLSSS